MNHLRWLLVTNEKNFKDIINKAIEENLNR